MLYSRFIQLDTYRYLSNTHTTMTYFYLTYLRYKLPQRTIRFELCVFHFLNCLTSDFGPIKENWTHTITERTIYSPRCSLFLPSASANKPYGVFRNEMAFTILQNYVIIGTPNTMAIEWSWRYWTLERFCFFCMCTSMQIPLMFMLHTLYIECWMCFLLLLSVNVHRWQPYKLFGLHIEWPLIMCTVELFLLWYVLFHIFFFYLISFPNPNINMHVILVPVFLLFHAKPRKCICACLPRDRSCFCMCLWMC